MSARPVAPWRPAPRNLRDLQASERLAAFVTAGGPLTTKAEREAWRDVRGKRTAAELLAELDEIGRTIGRRRA